MKASGTVQNVTSHNYLKQSGVKKYSVGGCGEKNTAWVGVVAASVVKMIVPSSYHQLSDPRNTNCPILITPIVH